MSEETNNEIIAKKICQLVDDEIPVQIVKVLNAKDAQLDAYKAALEKIAKRKSGEYIIDAYYEIRKIAEEVLQTKGVE